jgi:hypothetical protein
MVVFLTYSFEPPDSDDPRLTGLGIVDNMQLFLIARHNALTRVTIRLHLWRPFRLSTGISVNVFPTVNASPAKLATDTGDIKR